MDAKLQTYRIIALTLAFLMFISSAGITMDVHYCKGQFKSVSFFGKAKSCHEMASSAKIAKMGCKHHQAISTDKKGCSDDKSCCSNKTTHIQSDQNQQVNSLDFEFNKSLKQFSLAPPILLILEDWYVPRESILFKQYKPPKLRQAYFKLHEAFLL